jgi:hypothetical protein
MKVVVRPDGSVEFDVDNAGQALDIAAEAARRALPPPLELQAKPVISQRVCGPSMNDRVTQAWEVLVDNDDEYGVSIAFVARKLGITVTNAQQRLSRLANKGWAVRTHRGYYRATEGMGAGPT